MSEIYDFVGFSGAVRFLVVAAVSVGLVRVARHAVTWTTFGRQVLIALTAYFGYFLVRGLTERSADQAIANGRRIVDLEKFLGLFHERAIQDLIIDHDLLVDAMNWIYIWGHWPVIATVAVWLLIRHLPTFILYRNAFLISGAIGLVVFAVFPVAPPRLLPDLHLVDTVTEQSQSYRVLQPKALTNQYAAVPSLHFGWNLLIGIALLRQSPSLSARVFAVVLPVLMAFAVVATANHYVIDAVLGAAVALLGLWIAYHVPWMSAKLRAIVRNNGRARATGG